MTAPPLTEAAFQRRVIDTAKLRGWLAVHIRPALTAKGYRTPYEGDPGLPDLILARRGVVLLAELKSDRGKATTDQMTWLDHAGTHGRLWRPRNWARVEEELR